MATTPASPDPAGQATPPGTRRPAATAPAGESRASAGEGSEVFPQAGLTDEHQTAGGEAAERRRSSRVPDSRRATSADPAQTTAAKAPELAEFPVRRLDRIGARAGSPRS